MKPMEITLLRMLVEHWSHLKHRWNIVVISTNIKKTIVIISQTLVKNCRLSIIHPWRAILLTVSCIPSSCFVGILRTPGTFSCHCSLNLFPGGHSVNMGGGGIMGTSETGDSAQLQQTMEPEKTQP